MMDEHLNERAKARTWPADDRAWMTLADASRITATDSAPMSRKRVLLPLVLGAVLVLLLVGLSGSVAARRLAERESVNDAAKSAGLLADAVVQPALRDSLISGDPKAFATMDRAVHKYVLGHLSRRVKIWTPQGKVIYSDDPRLVGRTWTLGQEERNVFTHPKTHAEVSDLSRPENKFERGQGKLLEVYRPVWTPAGKPLLFETYAPYDGVISRAGQIWRGFAGITLTSLVALIVLMVPVVWRLVTKVRHSQQQREALLERAVEASTDERRRIAGNLHDGVIQDLAGASMTVSSAAARASAVDQDALASQLRDASATVRRGITAMRSLVVDIYPPNLETAGLVAALDDLVVSLGSRDIEVLMDVDPNAGAGLGVVEERLIYRVAHECLLNAMRHSQARSVTLCVRRDADATVLEVSDDGVGFEPTQVRANPAHGHFGLRVLGDLAREAGADLGVASAPGQGTRWHLRVPDPTAPARVRDRPHYALAYAGSGPGPDGRSDDGEGLLAHAFARQSAQEVLEPHPGVLRFRGRPGRLLGTPDVDEHRPAGS